MQPIYNLFNTTKSLTDWSLLENYLKSYECNDMTKTDLHFLLRQCKPSNHHVDSVDEELLEMVQLRIISFMTEKKPSLVDRNMILSLFRIDMNVPSKIINFLLECYENSPVDIYEKSDENWSGKFLCDACFGYCPVKVDKIKIFITKYPGCLKYCTNSSQKLFPIHKACQFKFRRRAKQENLRDSKSLFQLILGKTIQTKVFKDTDSCIGGLFKSDENNVKGISYLIQNVGEDLAWDWVLGGLKEFDTLPVLQVIIKNVDQRFQGCWIKKTIDFYGAKIALVRDCHENLPLHAAILASVDWDCGLRDIIEAYPNALERVVYTTGFLPFINIILLKDTFELSTLYNVIKYHPVVIRGYS